jgi:tetratricopeptide (TPR) repeat protein
MDVLTELLSEFATRFPLPDFSAALMETPSSTVRVQGNEFYKQNNYAAAVNMYSSAIRAAILQSDLDEIHKSYGNRAQCHIQMKNYVEVVRDTSFSIYLENLDPDYHGSHDPGKLQLLAKNLQRRATAFQYLGEPTCALSDMARVIEINPTDESRAQYDKCAEQCEAKYGWRIVCASCHSPERWLAVCPCKTVAYCSPQCEKTGERMHRNIAPNCTRIGTLFKTL